ncbi:MAG: acetyl-CoA carboxylase, carboxyltransferase subunit beta [Rickettsiales bacterium]|nr:acetyl-CoA carboxylase, carboxyltransferase subunit beta [Rickettsiales bacterium]
MSLFKKTPRGIRTKKHEKYDSVKRLMWVKCDHCGRLIYYKDYKENLRICPKCNHTFAMSPKQRLDMMFDDYDWDKIALPTANDDPLNFTDRMSYKARLREERDETGQTEALFAADGTIDGIDATIAIINPDFMMGTMGRVVGNGFIAAAEHAIERRQPFIIFAAGGGARMQENLLALMQMARTTLAVNRLRDEKIPYIVVLTDPTFGGITASFAMLGDINIAESGARIGFAGKRVIEQNIREKLPSNFQTADYLYDHGMVDLVSRREDLRENVARILRVMTKKPGAVQQISVQTPKVEKTDKHAKRPKIDNSAYSKVLLARNENRPHFLDFIAGLVSDWTPLAGDRLFGEDPAMQGGIGYFRGIPSVIIGQEKGRDIATRQKYRFGMPTPEGYRKAQRLMRLAEKFSLPVISLVDTDGAFAGREAEERGISQAIAATTQTGLSVATPFVSVITGSGGSGGAIAIATGDRVLMMENAIYSVISPESCASILWRDNKFRGEAATAMKLTARDAADLAVIDAIVPEPSGGAHTDWPASLELLGERVVRELKQLAEIPADQLPKKRGEKFLAMTRDIEICRVDGGEL